MKRKLQVLKEMAEGEEQATMVNMDGEDPNASENYNEMPGTGNISVLERIGLLSTKRTRPRD